MNAVFDPVTLARQFLFVREAGAQNRGIRVEAIQHWSEGQFGDSWCAEFATMILDLAYQGAAPIPRMGSCEAIRQLAMRAEWIATAPSVGDLALSIDDAGVAHHVGIVTALEPLTTIAGNTSEDGVSSNGDRVAEHIVAAADKVFVHYPR